MDSHVERMREARINRQRVELEKKMGRHRSTQQQHVVEEDEDDLSLLRNQWKEGFAGGLKPPPRRFSRNNTQLRNYSDILEQQLQEEMQRANDDNPCGFGEQLRREMAGGKPNWNGDTGLEDGIGTGGRRHSSSRSSRSSRSSSSRGGRRASRQQVLSFEEDEEEMERREQIRRAEW
jgi:hypothetical protein